MSGERIGRVGARVVLLGAVALLGACNRDSAAAPSVPAATRIRAKAPAIAKSGPTAAEQTAGMVEAASEGKSLVPVSLKFDIPQRPKVGQPLQIDLALIAQIPAAPLTVQASGDDLSLAAGGNQFEFPAEEPGGVYRHTLSVTPQAEGVLLLGVTVLLKHDEITDQRVFLIPIIAER